ncbi:MAG: prepilin-type N-terminal cleavage/methylation domain-containing protein [Phycisphaerae bacterium]|nr:prepilin-type N-terminal cleavage/methylation domain-containing protein [Phycisphaerae bacterium]
MGHVLTYPPTKVWGSWDSDTTTLRCRIKHGAFTIVELIVVVVVAAILALMAMPDSDTAAKEQGGRVATTFEADVHYARSLSIARPDDPVVIKVDGDGNRYWLAKAASPDTPIAHPRTGLPFLRQFGPDGDPGMEQVQLVACDLGGDAVLGFDSLGGLDQQTPAILQLTSAGADYEVVVAPIATRTVTTKKFSVVLPSGFPAGGLPAGK